jgi:hypothetical protein
MLKGSDTTIAISGRTYQRAADGTVLMAAEDARPLMISGRLIAMRALAASG